MSLTLVQIQIILDTDLHVGQDDATDYMDSMILRPLNKKEKKSKSDMIGEVWQLQDPASVQAAFPRLIPHLHNTVRLERALVNGLFKYVWLQWAHHRSCARLCAQLHLSWAQATFPILRHNTSLEPSVAAF